MKCSECGGTGKVEFPMMSMNGDEYTGEWEQHECEVCNGTGEVQERTKIKCDDCKFEPECADYGWLGCKKFTPAPSEPQTNDEWRKTCSAEEFAEWIEDVTMWAAKEQGSFTVKGWEKWLKQPHTDKE